MTEHQSTIYPEGFDAAAAAPVLIVTGPTACGKTSLAVALCRHFNGEVISVDSRQVYRGLDIGTGKDLEEYASGGPSVPYHLIDVAEPGIRFDLHHFLRLAREAIVAIRQRGHLPVLCGGTPLYLAALMRGYVMAGGTPDPEQRRHLEEMETPQLLEILQQHATPELLARTDTSQKRRIVRAIEIACNPDTASPPPPLSNTLILAPLYTRTEVRERIRIRLEERLAHGMLDEITALHQKGLSWEEMDWLGLEYRFIGRHLSGQLTYEEMYDQLLAHIRQFAKRQDIWFRRLERDGECIHWIDHGNLETACKLTQQWLRS